MFDRFIEIANYQDLYVKRHKSLLSVLGILHFIILDIYRMFSNRLYSHINLN